jgi:hypothetical protein
MLEGEHVFEIKQQKYKVSDELKNGEARLLFGEFKFAWGRGAEGGSTKTGQCRACMHVKWMSLDVTCVSCHARPLPMPLLPLLVVSGVYPDPQKQTHPLGHPQPAASASTTLHLHTCQTHDADVPQTTLPTLSTRSSLTLGPSSSRTTSCISASHSGESESSQLDTPAGTTYPAARRFAGATQRHPCRPRTLPV